MASTEKSASEVASMERYRKEKAQKAEKKKQREEEQLTEEAALQSWDDVHSIIGDVRNMIGQITISIQQAITLAASIDLDYSTNIENLKLHSADLAKASIEFNNDVKQYDDKKGPVAPEDYMTFLSAMSKMMSGYIESFHQKIVAIGDIIEAVKKEAKDKQ